MPDPAEYLTVAEAAKLLGVTARHVERLLKDGVLKGRKPVRDWFVVAESVQEYSRKRPKPGPRPGSTRQKRSG